MEGGRRRRGEGGGVRGREEGRGGKGGRGGEGEEGENQEGEWIKGWWLLWWEK